MSTPQTPSTNPGNTRSSNLFSAKQEERRRHVRGSLWLAAAVLLFAMLRSISHEGLHRVFGVGWWRLW